MPHTRNTCAAARPSLCGLLLAGMATACSGGDKPTGTTGGTDTIVAAVQLTNIPTAFMFIGDSVRLGATAVNASGGVVVNQSITWASSATSVATISSTGMLVASDPGVTAISATVAGKVAQFAVEVVLGGTLGVAGGTVSSVARRFELTIPAGFLQQPTRFVVRPTPTIPADPRALPSSTVELTPAGVDFRMTATRLTLPYDAAGLTPALARESLQLYILDSARWTPVFGSTVNVVTRTVTGLIPRTGTFAVRSTPVDRIVLSGIAAGGALFVGDTSIIAATLLGGLPVDTLPRRPITWTSSAPAIVTVDSAGKLTARAPGTSTITAATDGKEATTTVTVTERSTGEWSRAAEWTTFGGNAQHTGYVDATVDPAAFRLRWSVVPMPGATLYQVTSGGQGVYANSFLRFAGQSLVSLDPATGAVRWRNPFDINTRVGQPTWDNGSLYTQIVEGGLNYLTSVNATDGSARYRIQYAAAARPWYAGPIVDGSTVVLGSERGIYGFRKETGASLFFEGITSVDAWTPAAESGTAYVVDGGVTGISAASGSILMRLDDTSFTAVVTPVIAAPGVLVASTPERMLAVNLATNAVRWAVDAEFDEFVVAAKGTVYAFESGVLVARSIADGSQSWTWTPPSTCGSKFGMIVTNNVLFIACDETTYALDLISRLPIWSYPTGGYLSLSGPQGTLYIAKGQVLTAIRLR